MMFWVKYLNEIHCLKSVRIRSFSGLYLPHSDRMPRNTECLFVFIPNLGKYRPQKLQIWTLFTQWYFLVIGPTNSTANDEQCSEKGPDFLGNRVDYRMNPLNSPKPIFLMCLYGKYVDCMECQHKLLFWELVNFDGDPDIYGHCA